MSLIKVFVGFRYGLLIGYPIAMLGTVVTALPPYKLATRLRTTTGLIGWLFEYGYRAVHVNGEFRGIVADRLSPAPRRSCLLRCGLVEYLGVLIRRRYGNQGTPVDRSLSTARLVDSPTQRLPDSNRLVGPRRDYNDG